MQQQNHAAPRARPNTAYAAEIQRIAEEQSAAAGTIEAKPRRSTLSTDPRDLDAPYPDLPATRAELTFQIGLILLCVAALAVGAYYLITHGVPTKTARTTIDLPAADCPLPTPGKVLAVTVLPTSDPHEFKTGCRTIAGRAA